ncbi:hypothetical protein L083_5227 [Actinoplanes sp. N902-109]|nr:hypothetical protein L083_5227 [Actinoplanes sp. N902-109]
MTSSPTATRVAAAAAMQTRDADPKNRAGVRPPRQAALMAPIAGWRCRRAPARRAAAGRHEVAAWRRRSS